MKGEYKLIKKPKKNSFAINVLKIIGIAGALVVATSNPRFGHKAFGQLLKHRDKQKNWQKLYRSIAYLRSKKLVETKKLRSGQIEVKIMSAGQEFIGRTDIDNLKIEKPDTWDKRFRLVIFDIPKDKHSARTTFLRKLKELDFLMIQKSVWLHPYDCINEIALLRRLFEIESCVKVVLVEAFEGDYNIRKHFSLL